MLKIGLTGGIGCGKSTAVDAFRVFGVPIIDADEISKNVVKKGSDALLEIANVFGDDVLLDDGELNRALLKEKIFSSKSNQALQKLEAILHPRIREDILQEIKQLGEQSSSPRYVIVDVPLLVEKHYQSLFDRIIVVDCLPEQQLKRVKRRDGMATKDIQNVIKAQVSREQRKKSATDILDNTGDVDTLRSQVEKLHNNFIS